MRRPRSAAMAEQRDHGVLRAGCLQHVVAVLLGVARRGAVEGAQLVHRQRLAERERHARLGAQTIDQGARRVERHDATVVHDGHPVAQALGLLHVVRREHHRGA